MECVRPCRSTYCHPDETPSLYWYCCRQPTITPRPVPATADFPAAECTRLLCGATLPHQTTPQVECTRLAAVRLFAVSADMVPLVSDYHHTCFLHNQPLKWSAYGIYMSHDFEIPLSPHTKGVPTTGTPQGFLAAAVRPSPLHTAGVRKVILPPYVGRKLLLHLAYSCSTVGLYVLLYTHTAAVVDDVDSTTSTAG